MAVYDRAMFRGSRPKGRAESLESKVDKLDRGIGQVAQNVMQTAVEGPMAGGIMQPLKLKPGGPVSLRDYYEKNLPIIQDIYGDTSAQARKDAIGQFLLSAAAPAGFAVARGDMDIAEALMRTLPALGQTGAQVKDASRKEKLAQRDAALKMAISDQAAAREAAAEAKKVQFAPPGSSIVQGGKVIGRVASKPAGYRTVYKLDLTQPLGYIPLEIPKDQKAPEGFSSDKPEVKSSQYYDKTTKKLVTIPDLLANQSERYVVPGDKSPIDAYDATGKKIKITMDMYRANPAAYFMDDPKATTDVYFNSAIDLTVDGVSKKFLPGVAYAIPNTVKNNLPFGSYSTKKPTDAKDVPQTTNVTPIEDIVFNGQTLPAGQMVASLPTAFVQANSSKFKTKDQVAAETAAEVREAAEARDAKKTTDMTFLEAGTYNLPTGVQITVEEGETRPLTLAAQEAIRKQNPNAFGKKAEPEKTEMINVRFLQSVNRDGVVGSKGQVKPVPKNFVADNMNLFEAVDQGTKDAPKLTAAQARTNMVSLVPALLNEEYGDKTFDQVRTEFEANLAAIIDRAGAAIIPTTVEGGQVALPPSIPSGVVDVLKKLNDNKTFADAQIAGISTAVNDFGLLAEPEAAKEPTFENMVSSQLNLSEPNLGVSGMIKRGVDGILIPVQNLFLGRATAAFPESIQAVKDVEAVNAYALMVYRNALPGQTKSSIIDQFASTLPNIRGITEANQQRAADASKIATLLYNMRVQVETQRDSLPANTRNEKERARLLASVYELENLEEQYRRLSNMLAGNFDAAGDPDQDPSKVNRKIKSVFDYGTSVN